MRTTVRAMFFKFYYIAQEKFGVAVSNELVDGLDGSVEKCADLGASRSEIVEALLTAYFRSVVNHTARVRNLTVRRRKGIYDSIYLTCIECTLVLYRNRMRRPLFKRR